MIRKQVRVPKIMSKVSIEDLIAWIIAVLKF